MSVIHFHKLTVHQRAEFEGLDALVEHSRRAGIDPKFLIVTPAHSGARRRARQMKARALKQARAAVARCAQEA